MELHDFGWALAKMREGLKVAREGWNGKGLWVTISGGLVGLPAEKFWNANNKAFAESRGGSADVDPYFTLKTAKDTIQMGWAPSGSDALATDWIVVD